MHRRYLSALFAAATLAIPIAAARGAFTFLSTDKTYDTTHPGPANDIVVGYTGTDPGTGDYVGPTSPIITVAGGGNLGGNVNLFNSSTLFVTGSDGDHASLIGAGLYANDNTTVTINGNSSVHGFVETHNNANLTISNGTIGYIDGGGNGHGLVAYDDSRVTISGGTFVAVTATGNAGITVTGGTFKRGALANDHSTIDIAGGLFLGEVAAVSAGRPEGNDGGTLNITGGTFNGDLACTEATLNFSAGAATGGTNVNSGTFNLSGGSLDSLNVTGSPSAVSITGGTITGDLTVQGAANLAIAHPIGGNLVVSDPSTSLTFGGSAAAATVSNHAALELTGSSSLAGPLTVTGSFTTASLTGGSVAGPTAVQAGAYLYLGAGSLQSLHLTDNSQVYIDHASAGDVTAGDYAGITLAGGTAKSLSLSTGASALFTGGSVTGNVTLADYSFLLLTGGSIAGNVSASGTSNVDLESQAGLAAVAGSISLHDAAHLIVEGVPVDPGLARPLSLSPFSPSPTPIYLYDNATLEIDGLNLAATLLDPNNAGQFSEYQLTGTLQDGTPLSNLLLYTQNGSPASFNLVSLPEPTLPLTCLLATILLPRRRPRAPIRH